MRANLVVSAAGTLRTPGLLARSGIAAPLLGQRLFLHPVSGCMATYDDPVDAWSGPMQSAYSDAYNYRVGNYGAKLEVAPTHPGLAAMALPWQGAAAHADAMSGVRYGASLIAVTRDRDPGTISLDDEATIGYRVSPFDAENLLNGLVGLVDVAFAGGATRVTTWHNRPFVLERAAWNGQARADFIDRVMRIGAAPCRQILFSAHQMGSAAMGAARAGSVVDPSGQVWGCDGLLVADGSIFPQSSGVNPMLTIMAMARRVAVQHAGPGRRGGRLKPPPGPLAALARVAVAGGLAEQAVVVELAAQQELAVAEPLVHQLARDRALALAPRQAARRSSSSLTVTLAPARSIHRKQPPAEPSVARPYSGYRPRARLSGLADRPVTLPPSAARASAARRLGRPARRRSSAAGSGRASAAAWPAHSERYSARPCCAAALRMSRVSQCW